MPHETIYECLCLQARDERCTQLTIVLRQGRSRPVNQLRMTVARCQIMEMVAISGRLKEAGDCAVPGFWEGNLNCRERKSERGLRSGAAAGLEEAVDAAREDTVMDLPHQELAENITRTGALDLRHTFAVGAGAKAMSMGGVR